LPEKDLFGRNHQDSQEFPRVAANKGIFCLCTGVNSLSVMPAAALTEQIFKGLRLYRRPLSSK